MLVRSGVLQYKYRFEVWRRSMRLGVCRVGMLLLRWDWDCGGRRRVSVNRSLVLSLDLEMCCRRGVLGGGGGGLVHFSFFFFSRFHMKDQDDFHTYRLHSCCAHGCLETQLDSFRHDRRV